MFNVHRVIGVALGLALTVGSAQAVMLYDTDGSTYTQDFNGLSASGTSNTWANDSTLGGWFAFKALPGGGDTATVRDTTSVAVTSYAAGTGSSSTGTLYSFGTGTDAERAMGPLASGTPGDFVVALVLQNTTGKTLTDFTLSYTGEQWRIGVGGGVQTLDFDYKISSSFDAAADLAASMVDGYSLTGSSTLDFNSLQPGSGTNAALDGNAAANRSAISDTVTGLSWGDGQYLMLRWWDDNGAGSDHGLALDDLSFTATPEPGTLLCLLTGLMLRPWRRSRQ